ncbi:hypothetical protein DPMN_045420 [Dreissena polymorpha]|uniref:Uncharacterized protein n=1 Tax=Dreissena polymorpha TaxID=45954 RepID=A0A9D4D614_DREPO|nr:hypothetical protein DPMN_045420 [Dreissena polymorpha]
MFQEQILIKINFKCSLINCSVTIRDFIRNTSDYKRKIDCSNHKFWSTSSHTATLRIPQ